MDTETDTHYTVAPCDFPDLPAKERIAAEVRYARALERRLGSHSEVATALLGMLALEEGELNVESQALVTRWRAANSAARTQGLQGLGDVAEAYFDVRHA